MRILYAEDERQLSMAVTEIMKMEGHEVDPVYDGKEAWEHLQAGSYDAAVLDIMMPKMDGIEVLKSMRQAGDYTPVLLLTAKTQVEDRIEGLSIGADDYLGKPFDMREFLARLNSMGRRATVYQDSILVQGNLSLNCRTFELTSPVTTLQLSSSEVKLLSLLMKKPDKGFTIAELRREAFPESRQNTIVELYLSYLRNKMRQLQSEREILEMQGRYYLGGKA